MNEVIPAGIDKKAIRELVNNVCQYTVVGLKIADKKTILNESIFEKIAGIITHAFREESGAVSIWVELEDGELSKYSEISVGDGLCKLCIFAIKDAGDNMRIITTDYTKDVAELNGQVFRRAK